MATRAEKRVYGTGSLKRVGNIWHARYYDSAGIRRSESTKKSDEKQALRFLQKRLGQIAAGLAPEPKRNVGKMAKTYFAHLEVTSENIDSNLPAPTRAWRMRAKKKEFQHQKRRWELHLEPHFGGARKVASQALDGYVTVRRKEKASDGTIQRELSLLQRILNYNEARDIPKFPRLSESLPRQGFIEEEQFQKLRDSIKDANFRKLVGLAYRYGFRDGELKNMLVRQVDFAEHTVALFKGTTKNSRARTVVMDDGTLSELRDAVHGKHSDECVFTWQAGRKRGQPIKDWRTSWESACKQAKLPKVRFHDLRRSAIRRMTRRGVPPLVARAISGHLTGSVFERYDITSRKDLAEAAKLIGDPGKIGS